MTSHLRASCFSRTFRVSVILSSTSARLRKITDEHLMKRLLVLVGVTFVFVLAWLSHESRNGFNLEQDAMTTSNLTAWNVVIESG